MQSRVLENPFSYLDHHWRSQMVLLSLMIETQKPAVSAVVDPSALTEIQTKGMFKDFWEYIEAIWAQWKHADRQTNTFSQLIRQLCNWIPFGKSSHREDKEDREFDDTKSIWRTYFRNSLEVTRINIIFYFDKIKFRKIQLVSWIVRIIRDDIDVDNLYENINTDCISLMLDYNN